MVCPFEELVYGEITCLTEFVIFFNKIWSTLFQVLIVSLRLHLCLDLFKSYHFAVRDAKNDCHFGESTVIWIAWNSNTAHCIFGFIEWDLHANSRSADADSPTQYNPSRNNYNDMLIFWIHIAFYWHINSPLVIIVEFLIFFVQTSLMQSIQILLQTNIYENC